MKPLNLIGRRYGKVVAFWRIPPAKKSNGRWGPTRWMCECDCGKIISVIQHTLRKNKYASCPDCRGACWNRAEKSDSRAVRQVVAVLTRIDWIRERLTSGRPFNADDIASAHNVSTKTAYRDIQVIRSYYGWDVKFDMRDLSYFLEQNREEPDEIRK